VTCTNVCGAGGTYRRPCSGRGCRKTMASQRPIGKPTFEDKIVQRAVSMLLEGESTKQDFYDFSYGFPPRAEPSSSVTRSS